MDRVLEALIGLLSVVVTSFVIPLLIQKFGMDKVKKIQEYAKMGVCAAEQVFGEGGVGSDKFKYVVSFLNSKGINLPADELKKFIEAAVYTECEG